MRQEGCEWHRACRVLRCAMSNFSFKNMQGGRTLTNVLTIGDLPPEVVMTLGTMGEKTKLALEWQQKLDFNVNERAAKDYLKRTGGWFERELRGMLPDTASAIILWLACGDFVEHVRDQTNDKGSKYFALTE